ncbi:MAG: hypothetical protein AAF619_06005 [Pseudomonadota bacterium]
MTTPISNAIRSEGTSPSISTPQQPSQEPRSPAQRDDGPAVLKSVSASAARFSVLDGAFSALESQRDTLFQAIASSPDFVSQTENSVGSAEDDGNAQSVSRQSNGSERSGSSSGSSPAPFEGAREAVSVLSTAVIQPGGSSVPPTDSEASGALASETRSLLANVRGAASLAGGASQALRGL